FSRDHGVAVRHRHAHVLVRHDDHVRQLPAELLSLGVGLDDRREVGAAVGEEILDTARREQPEPGLGCRFRLEHTRLGFQRGLASQFDRAVVHHWMKMEYVPARWAGEVERITQGRISALEIINEASAKNPVRVKSRPEHLPFGLPESEPMSQYAPSKRIQSFHPPQRTLMGPGPTEIHPRVLTTMSQPALGYLAPILFEMMEVLKWLLRCV